MKYRQLILMTATVLALWVYIGFEIRRRIRDRRRRRQLVEEGVVAKPGKIPRNWFAVLLAVPLVGAMFWVNPWLEARLGKVAGNCAMYGGLAVVVFIAVVAWQILSQDSAIRAARGLEKSGKRAEAIATVRAALETSPSHARWSVLGALLSEQESWIESAAAFREASQLAPQLPIYVVHEALALSRLGRHEEAMKLIENAKQKFAFDSALVATEAILFAELGRDEEAGERMRQADEFSRVAPDQQRVDWLSRGKLLMLAREKVKASATRGFDVQQKST
jgi:tetratricopeptide (TPR) repeat protein